MIYYPRSGNVSMTCIEKAKLSENIVVSKKSLIAENMINEKKKKEDKDWIEGAFKDSKKGKLTDLLWQRWYNM